MINEKIIWILKAVLTVLIPLALISSLYERKFVWVIMFSLVLFVWLSVFLFYSIEGLIDSHTHAASHTRFALEHIKEYSHLYQHIRIMHEHTRPQNNKEKARQLQHRLTHLERELTEMFPLFGNLVVDYILWRHFIDRVIDLQTDIWTKIENAR